MNPNPDANGLEWSATLCSGEYLTFAEAANACASLGDGWRLPTRSELDSILDLSRNNPAVDVTLYPDTQHDWYWSSTLLTASPDFAWCVDFGDGYVDNVKCGLKLAFARAVRRVPAG